MDEKIVTFRPWNHVCHIRLLPVRAPARTFSAVRLIVFGASGRTGRKVVEAAIARAVRVAAFVRDPGSAPSAWQGVEVHAGDARDAEAVGRAMQPGDVVVSTLGGVTGAAMSEGTRAIVGAMHARGAARVVALCGAGVLQWDAERTRYEHPDYPAALREVGSEHQRVHATLVSSGLAWLVVGSPRILDAPAAGRLVCELDYLPEGTGAVTTGDLAELIVSEAISPRAVRARLGVNSRDANEKNP